MNRFNLWLLGKPPVLQAVIGGCILGVVIGGVLALQAGIVAGCLGFAWCVAAMFVVGLARRAREANKEM